ncbi:MAG: hypothetical protein I3J02_06555 [Prevotella sp.]|nr:hypothetical protein [Prevotella sp.]
MTEPIIPFHNLDVSLSAGSTGIGLELSSDISKTVRLRAGFSMMPQWSKDMKFGVQVGDEVEAQYDANGNRVETKFDRLQKRMKELTGYDVDENIYMVGKPRFWNFSLLADVMPLANKHWHVTAGFYWGNAKLADAIVSRDDMTTMLAVGMYNNMYTKAMNQEPFVTMDGIDVYNQDLSDKLIRYGRMKYSLGSMKSTGEQCYTEPDANGIIKAEAIVNNFKPYLGFGYDGRLGKDGDGWKIGVDAGVLFYGGAPHLYTDRTVETVSTDPASGATVYSYTKERVDLTRDVTNYRQNIEGKMKIIKALVVYPVLNVKITKTLF